MQLAIQQVLPVYFNESVTQTSEIWGKQLVFEKGELIKIVAPSGSGKSSLINFLYGMRSDYNGTISYSGKSMSRFSLEELARYRKDHISIVFQDMKLFEDQTVQQNLEIKRQLNPYHPVEKIKEMAMQLGVADRPAIPTTLTIRPPCCSRIAGSTARMHRTYPRRLSSNADSHCLSVITSNEPTGDEPALLIRMSTRPSLRRA